MRDALVGHGYPVLEATGYSDAMAMFDMYQGTIKLLITGAALADGTGCALALAMRKQKPDLRALFVAFSVGAEVCKYYGLDPTGLNFFQKPFRRDQFIARVGQLLKSPAATPPLRGPKVMRVSANIGGSAR